MTVTLAEPPGQRITELLIKSKASDGSIGFNPVQDDQLYNVAIEKYLANGGDGFFMIAEKKTRHLAGNQFGIMAKVSLKIFNLSKNITIKVLKTLLS